MADPTNPNDPKYKNDPNYIFSGGRWQYRGSGASPTPPVEGKVTGESLGTPQGLFGKVTSTELTGIPGAAHWMGIAKQGAARQQAVNPYDAAIADRARAAQMALMAQMRAQAQKPSLAAMQGQQALAQGGQQALRAAAMGQPGRASMLGMAQAGAGMGADVARARLAEQMRAQAGIGGLAASVRGADLRSAQEQLQAGMQAQSLADQRARAFAQMGANLGVSQDKLALENWKLYQRLMQGGRKANEEMASLGISAFAPVFGGAATGGA